MRELSVAEQRYEAVRAVIADGETVTDVGCVNDLGRFLWLLIMQRSLLADSG
jgi:hypothetical protein